MQLVTSSDQGGYSNMTFTSNKATSALESGNPHKMLKCTVTYNKEIDDINSHVCIVLFFCFLFFFSVPTPYPCVCVCVYQPRGHFFSLARRRSHHWTDGQHPPSFLPHPFIYPSLYPPSLSSSPAAPKHPVFSHLPASLSPITPIP